jgi:Ca-activated chloride channel family protein
MTVNIKAEHGTLKAGEKTSLGLMIELTAPTKPLTTEVIQRTPKGVIFCIDKSGSMGGGRLDLVKRSVLDLLSRLNRDDYFGVISFDGNATVEIGAKKLAELNLEETRKTIQNISLGGNTNLERGYRFAIAEAAKLPEGIESSVILLSDGQANAGVKEPALLAQLAAAATEHLIKTSTLGIGEGYDEQILDALSVSGQGNHFAAVRLTEAIAGLEAEFDGLLARTMENVTVEIKLCLPKVRDSSVRRATYVDSFTQSDASAKATLGNLASGEEKNFVFDLNLEGQDVADELQAKAFTVEVSYQDLVENRQVTTTQDFRVSIASEETYVEPARDEDILAELAAIRAEDRKEEAIELMRQGDTEGARRIIEALGRDFDEMMGDYINMSDRQRARMSASYDEVLLMQSMAPDEFVKRGVESVNRGRRSKTDGRKGR